MMDVNMIGVKYNFMSNLKYYYYEKNVFIFHIVTSC